ncbi:MAG TPA: hypothetical protein VKN62_08745 [Pelovirga sp.]|nr:hypothetical protein [Pelovirga sp.]
MKTLIFYLLLTIFFPSFCLADDYNTDYCHDPVELHKWEQMLSNDPESEALAVIHALWIGLCVKVETRQLTTMQANRLFERFRDTLIEQIRPQKPSPDGKNI